ncbi:MAG: hypothetical protein KDD60_08900, partial [Bdellovibrionales bacterium]|nr:hypothetical protein [Bdellovibrionales bacterium]
ALGQDYVVYAVPHRLAQLNRFDVEFYLAEFLEKDERPREVILTEPGQSFVPENEAALRSLVSQRR